MYFRKVKTAELDSLARRLEPVDGWIAGYDSRRPLNREARRIEGKKGALQILWTELQELVELRDKYDGAPPYLLNGGRKELAKELGDVVFGFRQYFNFLNNRELGRNELLLLGGVATLMLDTESRYGLDLVECGAWVNWDKNSVNNPEVFYQRFHPLDPRSRVIKQNDTVRRGLREIRNLNPEGVLTRDNLDSSLRFWGYTGEVLNNSGLALEFITKVARDGVKL